MWVTTTNVPCGSHGFEVRSYLPTHTRYDWKKKEKIFIKQKLLFRLENVLTITKLWFKPRPRYFYKYFGNFSERKNHLQKELYSFKHESAQLHLKYIFLIIRFQLSNLVLMLALIRDLK